MIFDGTETSLYIYAAISNANSLRLASHSSSNYVSSVEVLFVPSQDVSDSIWCDQLIIGDCIISINPATTTDPTYDPTSDPTSDPTIDPTADPTSDPTTSEPTIAPTTKEPTEEPSEGPTTREPTEEPTVEVPDHGNRVAVYMVFLVVMIVILN